MSFAMATLPSSRSILTTCLLIALTVCIVSGDDSLVDTQYGPVQGVVGSNYRAFRGVPYMAPPVGNLRWANPQPPTPWSAPLSTVKFPPGCPQNCELPPHTCPDSQSENCIYLNVFTPRGSTNSLPVMVFFPGGHFEQGSSGCTLYDGPNFAASGQVVLVTVNYRLGFLGWLTTPNLPGNYGLRDQIMALQWIKNNIANFGGDPNKVTLFGQSAGATSVRAHLLSPLSKGLYNQVILESDPLSLPMKTTLDASVTGEVFLIKVGCPSGDINCLRSQSVSKILMAQKETEKEINLARPIEVFYPLVPTVDGDVVPLHIFEALQTGRYNHVPMIMGSVSQDCLLFIYKAMKSTLDSVLYEAIITFIFTGNALAVSEQYPPFPVIGDKRPQLGVLGTDYIFGCPARDVEHFASATPNIPLYLYLWEHALPGNLWGAGYPFCYGQVCHGSELPYVFDAPGLRQYLNFTSDEKTLSQSIMGHWTNFAHSGDPNVGPYTPYLPWPKWNPSSVQSMHFQTPRNTIDQGYRAKQCDFWDGIGYENGW